jgi:hypothetical protein
MPLGNSIQGTDPFTNAPLHFKDYKEVVRACYDVIKKCVAENERRGKVGDERFHVTALLRADPRRHTYLNLTIHEPNIGVVCSHPSRAYGGALSHAENLLGEWKVASELEEAACKQRDLDDARAKAKRLNQNATDKAASTLSGLSAALMQQK